MCLSVVARYSDVWRMERPVQFVGRSATLPVPDRNTIRYIRQLDSGISDKDVRIAGLQAELSHDTNIVVITASACTF